MLHHGRAIGFAAQNPGSPSHIQHSVAPKHSAGSDPRSLLSAVPDLRVVACFWW